MRPTNLLRHPRRTVIPHGPYRPQRIKRRYLVYLKDAKGRDSASIEAAASAIERFEEYVKRRDFRSFHIEQARGFKAHLMAVTNGRTGKPLSASTVHATLTGLRAFFVWLADQRGYASRIKYADAEYFNTSDNLPSPLPVSPALCCPCPDFGLKPKRLVESGAECGCGCNRWPTANLQKSALNPIRALLGSQFLKSSPRPLERDDFGICRHSRIGRILIHRADWARQHAQAATRICLASKFRSDRSAGRALPRIALPCDNAEAVIACHIGRILFCAALLDTLARLVVS